MKLTRISNQILRAFALVVTDRRWAAPLTATALGFGLFIGVAIGPSAAGTMAGSTPVLALAGPAVEEGEAPSAGTGEATGRGGGLGGVTSGGGESEGGGALGALPAPAPLVSEPALEPAPPAEEEVAAETKPKTRGGEEQEEEAEAEETTELKGAVVAVNAAAGSYALAVKGGELVPVHARELPTPGEKLTVTGARLANGSFGEEEKPVRGGKVTEVSFRGAVTFADPDPADPAYTVSGRGASLFVHVPPDPTGVVPALPVVGAYVTVTTAIEPDAKLVQRKLETEPGEPATYLDLAGIVKQVLSETAQLLLSADGSGESEKDLTLSVPAGIELAKLTVGDSYLATANVNPDGTLALAGIASDQRRKGADDAASAQGDLKR